MSHIEIHLTIKIPQGSTVSLDSVGNDRSNPIPAPSFIVPVDAEKPAVEVPENPLEATPVAEKPAKAPKKPAHKSQHVDTAGMLVWNYATEIWAKRKGVEPTRAESIRFIGRGILSNVEDTWSNRDLLQRRQKFTLDEIKKLAQNLNVEQNAIANLLGTERIRITEV